MEATAILLVHLTDLHIKSDVSIGAKRLEAIAGALGSVIEAPSEVVILLSGDIAYSGIKEEYLVVSESLRRLEASLKSWPVKKFHVISCPGNHDLDFRSVSEGLRATLTASDEVDGENPQDILAPLAPLQRAYFNFANDISGEDLKQHNCILSEKDIRVGDFCLRILSVNTSWSSQLHEVPGILRMPHALLVEVGKEADFAIVIGHHPLNWLTPRDAIRVSEWLDQTADAVLWGHEHRLDDFQQVRDRVGSNVSHQIGLPMEDDMAQCGLKLARIDIAERAVVEFDVLFDAGTKFRVEEVGSRALHHNDGRENGIIRFSREHQIFLDDPGAGFSHPRISRPVDLADLFVPPNFRDFRSGKTGGERVDGSVSLSQVSRGIYDKSGITVIFGSEQSGKTTLAKVFSREAKAKQFIPIYLDALNLKSINKGEIRGWLKSAVAKQYTLDSAEEVNKTAPARVIVILDNAHALTGGAEGVDLVLSFAQAKASRILILTSDNPTISLISVGQSRDENSYWKGADVYELLPLGHRRRGELIRRWVSLGRNSVDDAVEIEAEVRQVKTLLDRVLGKNSLPKYPLFVLVMLQQLEGVRENRTAVTNGSHGYLFEALISQSIDRFVRSHEISTVNNFLAAFAHALWVRDTGVVTQESISVIVSDFMAKLVQIDSDRLVRELVMARIISNEDGLLKFRYPYLYFYYLAKWVCANRSGDEAKALIDILVKFVHTERSSNVLMFVAHHGHEDLVIDKLLPVLDSLFVDDKPCRLEDHSGLSLRFRTSSQRAILMQGSASDVSDDHHSRLDKMGDSDTEEQSSSQVDDGLKLNAALKTIGILGQVLKSRATSVSPEMKIAIAHRVMLSTRRMMTFLYALTEEYAEAIVHAASEAFEKTFRLDREQAVGAANALIGAIVAGIAQTGIGRAADALGSAELKPLLVRLEAECSDIDSRLILLVAKISGEKIYPKEAVEDFVLALKASNVLPLSVLSFTVARRFYLEPPDRSTRDSACKLLGIGVKTLPRRVGG
jgi:hypothetical protein